MSDIKVRSSTEREGREETKCNKMTKEADTEEVDDINDEEEVKYALIGDDEEETK